MNITTKIDKFLDEAIQVDTRSYQASHGKTPRGRGGWIFAFDPDEEKTKNFNGTYQEALKQAKAEAKKMGSDYIKVMP